MARSYMLFIASCLMILIMLFITGCILAILALVASKISKPLAKHYNFNYKILVTIIFSLLTAAISCGSLYMM